MIKEIIKKEIIKKSINMKNKGKLNVKNKQTSRMSFLIMQV